MATGPEKEIRGAAATANPNVSAGKTDDKVAFVDKPVLKPILPVNPNLTPVYVGKGKKTATK
jgi:hypothetical protein